MKTLVETREALAQFANGRFTNADRKEHSRLVAAYVAAAVREDRTRQLPPSIFDLVFGRER